MKNNLYKDKYLISIYNDNDELITTLDNANEFSCFLEKPLGAAKSILTHIYHDRKKKFYIDKQKYYVHFIEN